MRKGDRLDAVRPGPVVTAKPPNQPNTSTEPSSSKAGPSPLREPLTGKEPLTGARFSVLHKSGTRREIAKIEPPATIADFYDFGNVLGKGGFSIVSEILHSKTFEPFAGKIVEKEYFRDQDESEAKFREVIETLLNKDHAFVVKMRHVFEDECKYYQVMASCQGGTLRQFVIGNENIAISVIETLLEQICGGLSFLHGLRLIHRDIKPDNIMLVGSRDVVDAVLAGTTGIVVNIVDFDMCSFLDDDEVVMSRYIEGTPGYMAPEVLRERRYSVQSDLFSFGCLTYFVAKQKEYTYADTTQAYSTNVHTEAMPIGHIVDGLCNWLKDVAQFCNVAARASAADSTPSSPLDLSQSSSTQEKTLEIPANIWRLVSWCLDEEACKRPISANELIRSCMTKGLCCPTSGSGESASAKDRRKSDRKIKKAGSNLSIPLPPGMIPDSQEISKN